MISGARKQAAAPSGLFILMLRRGGGGTEWLREIRGSTFVFYKHGRPRYFTPKLIHQRERSAGGFCKGATLHTDFSAQVILLFLIHCSQ